MMQLDIIRDMKQCHQTETQTVYEHGQSVQERTFQLIDMMNGHELRGQWKLPNWLLEYKDQIKLKLYPDDIIEEYTMFHDCGKPYCLSIDEQGRRHFANHAEVSYETWMNAGGNWQAAALMRMDMLVHKMKACDIEEFALKPEAMTLLLAALSEVHANGELFGGFESESFKIKWSQINKRGNGICKKLFGVIK